MAGLQLRSRFALLRNSRFRLLFLATFASGVGNWLAVIALQVDLIRKEHYSTLRGLRLQGKQLDELSQFLVGTTTDIFSVVEGAPVIGKSLGEVDLRSRSGATVIAVVREGKSYHNVGPDFTLAGGDRLVLLGDHKALDDAAQILNPLRETGES